MYIAVKEKPAVERTVKIYTKNSDGSKRMAGSLNVEYRQVSTDDINGFIENDLLPSDLYDEVVERVGPVGHPSQKDEQGNPVPLPDEEAYESVRNDWNALQQILHEFWEINRIDPKSRTSRRRRARG